MNEITEEIKQIYREHELYIPLENITGHDVRNLIYSALESHQQRLPTETEIINNIKGNIDGFIRRISIKPMKIRTIAPLVGSHFDDSVDLDGVSFRKLSEDDIATMTMVEWNMTGDIQADLNFNYNEPVLVFDHQFNMVQNPNDYSFTESMLSLHNIFKDKCRNALAAIRLTASKRHFQSKIDLYIRLCAFVL